MKRKMQFKKANEIAFESTVRVRFTETDPLGIVWHGNYIQYFEDGREAFGRHHGISYLHQKDYGFMTPIIESSCKHRLPLMYGDIATIKTYFVDSPAAKMIFRYEIYNPNNEIVCTGKTVQVFVVNKGELSLTIPKFFMDWKQKVGLLNA